MGMSRQQFFAMGAEKARCALRANGIYVCLRCGSTKLHNKSYCYECNVTEQTESLRP
jgi:hypothetical protein